MACFGNDCFGYVSTLDHLLSCSAKLYQMMTAMVNRFDWKLNFSLFRMHHKKLLFPTQDFSLNNLSFRQKMKYLVLEISEFGSYIHPMLNILEFDMILSFNLISFKWFLKIYKNESLVTKGKPANLRPEISFIVFSLVASHGMLLVDW